MGPTQGPSKGGEGAGGVEAGGVGAGGVAEGGVAAGGGAVDVHLQTFTVCPYFEKALLISIGLIVTPEHCCSPAAHKRSY